MWDLLNHDTTIPLLNRAIHAQYPPGSCFKTVTSVAAMNAGVFDPNWVVHCTGYFDIGNVHMVLKDEHGDVTYKDALTYSYNTYFATLGLKVGRDELARHRAQPEPGQPDQHHSARRAARLHSRYRVCPPRLQARVWRRRRRQHLDRPGQRAGHAAADGRPDVHVCEQRHGLAPPPGAVAGGSQRQGAQVLSDRGAAHRHLRSRNGCR